jgi:hypothetical protein
MEIHGPEWFAKLRQVNPQQAAMTSQIVRMAGRTDVCSICGDTASTPYRSVAEPGLTLRLCDDCKGIQKQMYGSSFDPI